MKHKKKLLNSLATLLLLVLATAASFASEQQTTLKIHTEWGGEFTLTDHHGIEVSLSDFAGKVVVLSFGYTHCPDICPTTMFLMKKLMKLLEADAEKVQVLFITLDPKRDSPARLQTYMEYFYPSFVALTGSNEQVSHVAKNYGTKYEIEPSKAPSKADEYSIAHTAIIYLLDQQGRIRVFYKYQTPPQQIKADIKTLLKK